MSPDRAAPETLPDAVRTTLDEFGAEFDLDLGLSVLEGEAERTRLYPVQEPSATRGPSPPLRRTLSLAGGTRLELTIRGRGRGSMAPVANVLLSTIERHYESAHEVLFFTHELTERYEEINLLYSISETLGSVLELGDAAQAILGEVIDVIGARRGSLWVLDPGTGILRLVAWAGDEGAARPPPDDAPGPVTARVFREGHLLAGAETHGLDPVSQGLGEEEESFLSVPIRHAPASEEPRTVGVVNLMDRRRGGRFSASDEKLLSAIANQIGAALENHRLIRDSLEQERVSREMELAHDLQMKLLPAAERFGGAQVAARVRPAKRVGGDFYQLLRLSGNRVGVMIGDVSGHGFAAALIMALSMSAASIYAAAYGNPSDVIRRLDNALRDELESTEVYVGLFYGVLDPHAGTLAYSNAGHPHAFRIDAEGRHLRLAATDPPVGISGEDAYHRRQVDWRPGRDLLLLFTDGLSDNLTTKEEGRGEAVVLREAARLRRSSPGAIVDALFELADETTPEISGDDRTALVLKV